MLTAQLPGEPKAYELAYEQARAGNQHQRDNVDTVHSRAGLLLGAAAIAASFLGGIALEDGAIGIAGIVAVLAFAGVAVATLAILEPYDDWRFILSSETLIDGWVEGDPPAGVTEMHRQLGLLMLANQEHNQKQLNAMWATYRRGLRALTVMIVLWLFELTGILPPLAL